MVRIQHALLYCRPGSAAKALTTWVRMWPSGESGLLQVGYGLNGGGTERLGQQMDIKGEGRRDSGRAGTCRLFGLLLAGDRGSPLTSRVG